MRTFSGPATTSKATPDSSEMGGAIKMWMELVHRVYKRFQKTTDNSPRNFTEKICLTFLDDSNKDFINECIVKVSKYQQSIYKYQNEILALTGVGLEFCRAEDILKEINVVVRWIEKILCIAMVDAGEVTRMYNEQDFEFQKS